MEQLKKCPFCGGKAEMMNGAALFAPDDYWVRCKDCEAETDVYGTTVEAADAWNMRAEP